MNTAPLASMTRCSLAGRSASSGRTVSAIRSIT